MYRKLGKPLMSCVIFSVVCSLVKVVLNFVMVCMNHGVYIAVACYLEALRWCSLEAERVM